VTARVPLDELDLVALDEVLLAERRGVVIDFWGTWCQPCRTLRPHLEQLAGDNADRWRFVAVHADEQPDVVSRYNVTSTPTLIFVRRGDEVDRLAGSTAPSAIQAMLTRRG